MNIKKQLMEFYDRNVMIRETTEKSPWKIMLRQRFVDLVKARGLGSLLEVGAGTGQDSCFFRANGIKVTCIDLSPRHIELCRDKGLDGHVMDFYQMKFIDGSFDALYAMNCLLHVPLDDLDEVLKELKRVVSDDGIFYIGNYGGRNSEEVKETSNGIGKRFFSFSEYDEYKRKLKEAGFEMIESGMVETEKGFCFNYYLMGKKIDAEQNAAGLERK